MLSVRVPAPTEFLMFRSNRRLGGVLRNTIKGSIRLSANVSGQLVGRPIGKSVLQVIKEC